MTPEAVKNVYKSVSKANLWNPISTSRRGGLRKFWITGLLAVYYSRYAGRRSCVGAVVDKTTLILFLNDLPFTFI